MAEQTGINWADSTFNPWIGCTKISPACDWCYAEREMDHRHHRVVWGGNRSRTKTWGEPRRWERKAAEFFDTHKRKRRVFCASLADVFDNQVPEEWRVELWQLIRDTPNLIWMLLTKRPQNIRKMLPEFWDEIKGHVWLGTTVEDQERANINVPHLLQHDSAVRFVSCEPLLGKIRFDNVEGKLPWMPASHTHFNALHQGYQNSIDWVITGGESGPKARPTHPQWFRDIRDQCARYEVPYLHKQNGEFVSVSEVEGDGMHYHFADGATVRRIGVKHAGRTIDGVTHDAFPAEAAA